MSDSLLFPPRTSSAAGDQAVTGRLDVEALSVQRAVAAGVLLALEQLSPQLGPLGFEPAEATGVGFVWLHVPDLLLHLLDPVLDPHRRRGVGVC